MLGWLDSSAIASADEPVNAFDLQKTGASCARTAVLNALAAVSEQAGGIDEIARIVRVVIYVASTPDFTGQPAVGNGASR